VVQRRFLKSLKRRYDDFLLMADLHLRIRPRPPRPPVLPHPCLNLLHPGHQHLPIGGVQDRPPARPEQRQGHELVRELAPEHQPVWVLLVQLIGSLARISAPAGRRRAAISLDHDA
jgi:hypothetical protein